MWAAKLILVAMSATAQGWQCGTTDEWESTVLAASSQSQPAQTLQRGASTGPIRISVHYGDMSVLTPNQTAGIAKAMPSALAFYAKVLSVYQLTQNLVVAKTACGSQSVPVDHQTSGIVDADLVVYVYATNSSSTYQARAAACAFDGENSKGSPLAGVLEINAAYFDSFDSQQVILLLRHEFAHILAFSSRLFPQFRKSDGTFQSSPLTSNPSGSKELSTPMALIKARTAFSCSTLQGIPLSDDLCHFSKKTMLKDVMVRTPGREAVFSDVLMAVFEDSGWYSVNYAFADLVSFGKDRGCSFFSTACVTNGSPQFPEYCAADNKQMCGDFNTKKALCNVGDYYTPIPTEFQYFSDPNRGGADRDAAYCPYVQSYINGDCTGMSPTAPLIETLLFGEMACPNCRCFTGRYINSLFNVLFDSASCHQVTCQGDSAAVLMGTTTIQCPKNGGQVTNIPGYTGFINCPSYDQICGMPCPNGCFGKGNCVNGLCACNDGYSGKDCVLNCDLSCKSCSDTGCLSCYEHASLVGADCVCSAEYKKSITTKRCILCDETCLTCSGPSPTQCLTCTENATFSTGSCPCNTSYFRSPDNTQCVGCHPTCVDCRGSTAATCLSCQSNAALRSGETVGMCLCNAGFFLKEDYTCSPCDASCKFCTGAEATKCSDCYENALLASGSCVCKAGYSQDLITKRCLPCHPTCPTCLTTTHCLTCTSNSTLQSNTCLCNDNFTRNTAMDLCVPCHPMCEKCQGTSAASCLTCKGSASLRSGETMGECFCNLGHYLKSDFTCGVCDNSCKSCTGTGATQCTDCYDGGSLVSGRCYCLIKGYFESGVPGRCSICSPNCLACKENAKFCTECDIKVSRLSYSTCTCLSTAFKSVTEACIACHPSCLTCSGGSYASCISCFPNQVLASSPGVCLCAANFYLSEAQKCNRCTPPCSECSGLGVSSCIKCYAPAVLTVASSCTCPETFYFPTSASNQCVKCHTNCRTCSGAGSYACLSCFDQAELSNFTCTCVSGTVPLPSVANCGVTGCHVTCKFCVNGGITGCSGCWANAVGEIPTFPTSCRCEDGYFPNSNSANCQLCDSSCFSCNSPSRLSCLTCKAPSVLIDNVYCGKECPTGQVNIRGFCLAKKSLIVQYDFTATGAVLKDKVGGIQLQANNTQDVALPYYKQGRYFNGTQAFALDPGSLLLGATFSMEFWIRSTDNSLFGCLFSLQTASNDQLLRFCVTDKARLLLEWTASSLKDPAATSPISLIQGIITRSRKWTSVGFQLELQGKSCTVVSLLIGRASQGDMRYQDLLFTKMMESGGNGRMVVGAGYSLFPIGKDFFTGSIAEMSIYNGKMPLANSVFVCPAGFVSSTANLCLNPCFSTEYQAGSSCFICESTCSNGCIKGSDCKIDTPYVCAKATSIVGCPRCGDLAEMTAGGDCQCTSYTVLSASGVCNCIKDYAALEGVCKLCLPYFTPSEITATFDSSYLKVIITFSRPLRWKPTCDQLFLPTALDKLGKGCSCLWDSAAKTVTVTLGLTPTLTSDELSLNSINLYSTMGTCSFQPSPLSVVVEFTGPLPLISIKLTVSPNYSLICTTTASLLIDASGTVGLKNRPMIFTWSVFSNPKLASLDQYQNFVTSEPKLSLPNSVLDTTKLDVSLVVSNTLGSSSSAGASIAVTGSTTIGLKTEIKQITSTLFHITATSTLTCTKMGFITYAWTFIETIPSSSVSFPSVASNTLTLYTTNMQVGFDYVFQVTATAGQYSGRFKIYLQLKKSSSKVNSNEAGESIVDRDGIELSGKGSDGGSGSLSVLPMGIVLTVVVFGLLSSLLFRVFDRKLVVSEDEAKRKTQAEIERRQIETAKMVLEKSYTVEQVNSTAIGAAANKPIRSSVSFCRLLLESHCVTGLFVHSSRLYRWMKVAVLTGTLVVEMTVIGLGYVWEAAADRETEYGYSDFLYCVSGLGVGLGVDLALLGLFTIAGKLHSRQRKIILAVSLFLLLLVTSTAAMSAIYLASDLYVESGGRWALNFLPTLAGELLICQTLAGLVRVGLLRLLD